MIIPVEGGRNSRAELRQAMPTIRILQLEQRQELCWEQALELLSGQLVEMPAWARGLELRAVWLEEPP